VADRSQPCDLDRVIDYPGFVEISNHFELEKPWAVGIRFGEDLTCPITWFIASSMEESIMQAAIRIECIGAH
jgi:hypothetical protein